MSDFDHLKKGITTRAHEILTSPFPPQNEVFVTVLVEDTNALKDYIPDIKHVPVVLAMNENLDDLKSDFVRIFDFNVPNRDVVLQVGWLYDFGVNFTRIDEDNLFSTLKLLKERNGKDILSVANTPDMYGNVHSTDLVKPRSLNDAIRQNMLKARKWGHG